MKKVYFLIFQGVEILDLAGPAQVFETANTFGAKYELFYIGSSLSVKSAQGLELRVSTTLSSLDQPALIVIPGVRQASTNTPPREMIRWLRNADLAKIEFASVCSGAFILGMAGLLDGRKCTTHWSLTEKLQKKFPRSQVQEGALFVQDGRVTTSAGIASGIDMCLSLVERDHGPLTAAKVAREMVVYLRRDGSQPQSSIYLQFRTHLHPTVHRVQDWMINHFTERLPLARLGTLAGLSGRQFSRLFKTATGLTPLDYQQRLRLELASSLMHDPKLSMDEIGERCGFEDSRSLRRLWNKAYGHSPSLHRTPGSVPKNDPP